MTLDDYYIPPRPTHCYVTNPFRVGDRVVCINETPSNQTSLTQDQVYVVRGITEENIDIGQSTMWLANRFEHYKPETTKPILDDELFELGT